MSNSILFSRNSNIGAADAEFDDTYLENCFVDTGDLATLSDCANPKAIVLGRTGAGKTALLKQMLRTRRGKSVELSPEALSLNFVTNSAVIQFFEEAGVRLDIFYTLLWRHIITVELLKLRYGIENELKQQTFFGSIVGKFSVDLGKAKAI